MLIKITEIKKINSLYKTKILKCIDTRYLIRVFDMLDIIMMLVSGLEKNEDVSAFQKIKNILETFR